MIVRVSIANIDAKGLAQRLQAASLDGTCFDHVGTARWGVEAGATLETVTDNYLAGYEAHPLNAFIVHTLRDLREEAAYLTVDGRLAFILTAGAWITDVNEMAPPAPGGALQLLRRPTERVFDVAQRYEPVTVKVEPL